MHFDMGATRNSTSMRLRWGDVATQSRGVQVENQLARRFDLETGETNWFVQRRVGLAVRLLVCPRLVLPVDLLAVLAGWM
jgi:hypothetical protein